MALRAVGMRARGVHRSLAGSYISTRSTLLLALEMKADHIDLVADADGHMVIAREQEPAHGFPSVTGGVVFLDGRHHVVRARRMDAVLVHARERVGAAGDVDLAVGDASGGCAASRRHRRELFPFIRGGIVFPGVVDRVPTG